MVLNFATFVVEVTQRNLLFFKQFIPVPKWYHSLPVQNYGNQPPNESPLTQPLLLVLLLLFILSIIFSNLIFQNFRFGFRFGTFNASDNANRCPSCAFLQLNQTHPYAIKTTKSFGLIIVPMINVWLLLVLLSNKRKAN